MPVALDELARYPDEEIKIHVQQLLRPGEDFQIQLVETWWEAEILFREGESSKLLWDQMGFDQRLLLLDAYGWLWSRLQPATASSVWVRQREVTREDLTRRAVRHVPIPDPEDLDPKEVQMVYEGQHTHGKKG
jgi:hypothetical protein